jgi:hypothetical protein
MGACGFKLHRKNNTASLDPEPQWYALLSVSEAERSRQLGKHTKPTCLALNHTNPNAAQKSNGGSISPVGTIIKPSWTKGCSPDKQQIDVSNEGFPSTPEQTAVVISNAVVTPSASTTAGPETIKTITSPNLSMKIRTRISASVVPSDTSTHIR